MNDNTERLSKSEHERIFREQVLPKSGLDTYTSQEHPKAIILAGQPGAGKGGLKAAAQLEFGDNIFPVDPDEQRIFHPKTERWQQESPYGWSQKTNADAGQWAQELRSAAIEGRKNLIVDTTLGDADSAIRMIRGLQAAGYEVEVRAVATHRLESEHGIDQRFTKQIDLDGYGRDVPLSFHDKVYPGLPGNLDKVRGTTDAPIRIYDREGNELYHSVRDAERPSVVLQQAREARLQDPNVTQQLRERWGEQADWHRELPERIAQNPKVSAATAVALQHEQQIGGKIELSAQRVEAAATLDELVRPGAPPARTPIPEPEIPGLRRTGMTAGAVGVGIALSAYDAHQTGQRVDTLLEQDNPSAAQSELNHFGARGLGGWAGATGTAFLVGTSGVAPLALAAADAYLLSEAFERGAMLLDNRRIYHQTDRDGVKWEYNGSQWTEQRLADLHTDGVDRPQMQSFSALPEKERELNYKANYEATVQAMGKVRPRDPYGLPADASDRAHLYQRDWKHDPATGTWSRSVADEVNRNDQPLWNVEAASPERTARLNQQALQVIDGNITNGAADLAARYQRVYHRNGESDFGPMPPAVVTALNPDHLQAADGKQYHRNEQGQWWHDGERAQGNTALELETTRQQLQPALERHAQALAASPGYQPPTPEQQDRANIVAAYHRYGVNPVADWPAIQSAIDHTRQAHGLDAAISSVALQPDESGKYSVNSPVQHLRLDSDGVVRAVAMTTPEEIEQARAVTRTPASAQEAPTQAAPSQPATPPPPNPEQAAIDSAIQQRQLQRLQQEEQRHTTAIQAASEQKEVAQATLGSGLRLSDPEHPAYDNYEQARRAVVEMYSHQRKEVDERIEPMAASVVAQAQRDGLAHINDVKPSVDGQQLIASNTREANAAHRETAQLPMAQAANQSVEESSRQWATHQIAQAQERIQEHTQARANVQERIQVQAQAQEFARAQTATPERAPAPAYTQAPQSQVVAPAMTAGIEAPMPQPAPPMQAQEQPTIHTPDRAPVEAFAPAPESQVAAPTLSASIDTRMPQQTPQMQPQPYIPAPEHAPSHTFAPAPEPQVAAPAMTADSDMQVQILLAAQQAQQLAQQMLLQQQHIAELERQLQDKRSQEERREAERRDDQYREARQPDAQQHDDPMQKEATASGHALDPRHPQHPDHALYQGIRGKVVDLFDAHGVACNDEQLECVTARIARDAKKANMRDVAYLSPSYDAQDRPDLDKGIFASEHEPFQLYSRFAHTPLQQAMRTPLEDSYQELEKFTQHNLEQQRQSQLEREHSSTHGIHGPGLGPSMGR